MKVYLLPNGNLLIPVRAQTGNVIGDGMKEITPSAPDYKKWLPFAVEEAPKSE